jgi:hypothetical protein
MFTGQPSEEVEKSPGSSPENRESSAGKIIDFFAAREALQSDARSAAEQAEFHQQIGAAARDKGSVHLSNPWEDLMLLLLLIAAVVLGLLIISGFG